MLLAIAAGVLFFTIAFRESLPKGIQGSTLTAFGAYLPVVRNRVFMRYVGVQALAMGVMFAYIGSSPFVFQEYFGLSPLAYSLCFGVNALGIMGGSLLILSFGQARQALRVGVTGFLGMSFVVALVLLSGASWEAFVRHWQDWAICWYLPP